jgi:hypothetical protein
MAAEFYESGAKNRFKPLEIQVEGSEPFLHDKLDRKCEIENLSQLLINSEAPLVLAVDAEWGSGKTTFLKMWKAFLAKEHPSYASIYFSAWETDLSDDPLYVFLGEINKQLAFRTSGMTRFKWKKAINLAGLITKRSLPTLAKVATYGALDLKDSGIERTLAELSGGITSDGLDAYEASISAIEQFKENLSTVLLETGNNHPVIVFVDELDRCRPQYAITLIERIKHLLNLPGIIFVLGIDRNQLANAIRGVYGDRFDSETYLQRFIDLDYRLSRGDAKDFIAKLVSDYGLDDFFAGRNANLAYHVKDEHQNLISVCADVAKLFRLSLREIEQLLARVNIVARSTASSQPIYPYLLVGLLALRTKEFKIYSCLVDQKGTSLEFLGLITQKWADVVLDTENNIGIMVACVIEAFAGNERNDPGIAYISAKSTATNGVSAAEQKLMASAARFISIISRQPSMRINLDGLAKRIEMAQSFLV